MGTFLHEQAAIVGRLPRPLRATPRHAWLLLATLLVAPSALAKRDVASQAACLAKQLRAQNGAEGGRGAALKSHFDCFPQDPRRFAELFDGAGPLADRPSPHLEMFFAARTSVSERAWSAKAVGVIAGGEWRRGIVARYALLLRINIKARPTGPLDAAGQLDDGALESFWRVLFTSQDGYQPDRSLCGHRDNRACDALAAIR